MSGFNPTSKSYFKNIHDDQHIFSIDTFYFSTATNFLKNEPHTPQPPFLMTLSLKKKKKYVFPNLHVLGPKYFIEILSLVIGPHDVSWCGMPACRTYQFSDRSAARYVSLNNQKRVWATMHHTIDIEMVEEHLKSNIQKTNMCRKF